MSDVSSEQCAGRLYQYPGGRWAKFRTQSVELVLQREEYRNSLCVDVTYGASSPPRLVWGSLVCYDHIATDAVLRSEDDDSWILPQRMREVWGPKQPVAVNNW